MKLLFAALLTAFCWTVPALSQVEGPVSTQALVNVDSKAATPIDISELTVSVNDHKQSLRSWTQVAPDSAQIALLIDGGLRQSVGREMNNLGQFLTSLPPGVEVLVGYMENGRVIAQQPFTANHEQAAAALQLPSGMPGISASPYLCLSDFVKKWPSSFEASPSLTPDAPPAKARFVLMISNGVDPYNGSTSIMNQDSPYVSTAVTDAQRAGVAVYAIYYGDAGYRGGSANLSGQSYLSQITQATGGVSYYEGTGNPVSMEPFLKQFQHAVTESYVATFDARAQRELVRFKISAPHVKLHAPEQVRAGNRE